MKKKALFIAIAGALAAPGAYAAEDTSGMRYTSASEGFYASIRVRLNSGANDNAGMDIQNSASRLGVRGSSDIGGGSEFFYQYEMGVDINNGGSVSTRVGRVGLRGNFGQVQAGSFWTQSYNWVHGSTDIANVNSGNLNYTALLPGRTTKAVEYTTPDMNGFQGAVLARMDNTGTDDAKDENDVDSYILAAKYGIQGFTAGISYTTISDGLDVRSVSNTGSGATSNYTQAVTGMDDQTAYAVKLGYAQDNWYVNGWYSKDNTSDAKYRASTPPTSDYANETARNSAVAALEAQDVENMSIAGGVSMGKVALYAVWEVQENVGGNDGQENSHSTLGAQYRFNGQSRVWLEYAGRDFDTDSAADDSFTIGLRHDF